MKEAHSHADDVMRRLLMERTPFERLRMSARMFTTARALVLAGIAAQSGATDATQRRRVMFLRFYGNDFAEEQRKAILRAIAG